MTDNRKVMVCDKCLTASCWYGEFMCDDARTAGLKVVTIDDLKKLAREHPENWEDEKLIRVYGTADRDFRP